MHENDNQPIIANHQHFLYEIPVQ